MCHTTRLIRAIKDSTISSTLSNYPGIRTIYYEYTNNLMVAKTIYPYNSSGMEPDSMILDNNGNETKRIYRKLDQSNNLIVWKIRTTNYATTRDQFFNTAFGLAIAIVNNNGSRMNKNLESATTYTNYYDDGSVSEILNNSIQYTLDANGYILNYVLNETFAQGTSYLNVEYSYY